MAPSYRDLQLTAAGIRETSGSGSGRDRGDLEDVRLLDAYEGGEEDNLGKFDDRRTIQVRVTGMTCAACSNSVEGALRSVDGVLQASVALLQNRADVVFDPSLVKVGYVWNLDHAYVV